MRVGLNVTAPLCTGFKRLDLEDGVLELLQTRIDFWSIWSDITQSKCNIKQLRSPFFSQYGRQEYFIFTIVQSSQSPVASIAMPLAG